MAARPADSRPHILFVTGGSAGHLLPMLAVKQAVLDEAATRGEEIRLSYVGTAKDLAAPVIRDSKLPFERHAIRSGKLNRFVTWKHLPEMANLGIGFVQAQALMARLKPDLVFSKGTAVSVPIALAAKRLSIPVYAHETDIRSGLANRIVAGAAKRIFTSYPIEYFSELPAEKLRYVGQPVRNDFFNPPQSSVEVEGKTVDLENVICVTGGSQGAHAINVLIQANWTQLLSETSIVHLCGAHDHAWLQEEATKLPTDLRQKLHLTAFLQEGLPQIFSRSRVVISRPGGTIGELAATSAATIVIPLTGSAQDHQWANARMLAQQGATLVFDEQKVTPAELLEQILAFVHAPDSLEAKALRESLHTFSRPHAAKDMATELLDALHVR